MMFSMLFMAVPIGIIGYSFTTVFTNRKQILFIQETRDRLLRWGYGPRDVPKIFAMYDAERSGDIDLSQFRLMIKEMGIGLHDDRVVELFNFFDTDGGGTISEHEFVRLLYPNDFADMYGKQEIRQNIN